VVGAGLGGTVAATLLHKADFEVHLYEQAASFARLGAGIHVGPNVTRVLREVGIEDELNRTGSHPDFWYSRDGVTGEICAQIPLGDYALKEYGSSYLTVHRGDFQQLLTEAVPSGILSFNKKLEKVEDLGDKVALKFADGTTDYADLVVGADGVNSVIRSTLLGPELPKHTGYIAHRAVFNTPDIKLDVPFDMCTKWWGDDRHMMVYYVTNKRDQIYFVTGVPGGENWDLSKSWVPSSKDELREAFAGWHPTVQALIEGSEEITLWPLLELEPLPLWSRGRLVLLGDACHPMKPHMGQGAAMAIEDAAMLTRCLLEMGPSKHEQAFKLYEKNRAPRTARVQSVSHDNTWLRTNENPDWCFGYDVFGVPLENI